MNFRYKLSQFLYGRYISYGIDLLTGVILITCIVLSVLNILISQIFLPLGIVIDLVETGLIVWMFFRLLSKNIQKRQAENRPFLNAFNKIKSSFELKQKMKREKETHIYKKCPHCSVILRLPRKPGEHNVNCPRCKNNFKVKVK